VCRLLAIAALLQSSDGYGDRDDASPASPAKVSGFQIESLPISPLIVTITVTIVVMMIMAVVVVVMVVVATAARGGDRPRCEGGGQQHRHCRRGERSEPAA
jgi:hypothetical protein